MHIDRIKGNRCLRELKIISIITLFAAFSLSQISLLNLTRVVQAAEPSGFSNWAKNAKLAGASVWTGMTQQELDQVITDMVAQKVTVIEADSDLSNYLTDAQFEQELALMRRFTTEAHKRGLRVVWYYPTLEVLTPNGKNIENTMFKDHPDWVQFSLDGLPNVFYGGDARVHWVEPNMESAWMCPESPYRDFFINRVQRIAATGIDGLWGDVPLFNDIGVKWAGFNPYATAKFEADTGLSVPTAEDWSDPTWRRWIAWRHQEIADFLRDVASAGRVINPEFSLIVETVTLDYNAATVIALDGADLKNSEGITQVWEIDALSDGDAMRASQEDDWISLIAMNKFGRAASGMKPSWVFTYGLLDDDAELVMAEALATRNNPYETKIPEMTTTVGAEYRTRMFDWAREYSPYLFEAESSASVAVLYSSPSRDYVDQAGGVGLYTDTTSSDSLWWSTDQIDSAYQRQYLAEYRGMVKMLVHEHFPFDTVVNPADSGEFAPYEAVILPDVESISDSEADMLRQYVLNGGNLVVTGPNPTGLDEYGTARSEYALADLLGFGKSDPLPAETQNSYGAGHVRFYSALLGKDYFVSSGASALQTLSDAVHASSTIPLTTNADRRVHFELSHLGEETILQFVNFIGVNGAFSVVPTTFSVNFKIPAGKQVSGVALTSPDLPDSPALNPLAYTESNQQISFDVTLQQYAAVVVSFAGAQTPPNNNTPIAGMDDLYTDVNTPLAITDAILLANDGDLDGDSLVVTAVDATNSIGSLSNQGGGSYSYLPLQNFVGTDALTYTIADGNGGTDSGLINIAVAPPKSVYYPETVTITVGTYLGGTMDSFAAVDGDTYDIRYAAVSGGQQTDWYVTTTISESPDNIAQIKATHIGQYNKAAVTQDFYVYNFQDQLWELVDTSLVGNEDDVPVSWIVDSGISKYVSAQGELRVRISGFKTANFQSWSDALYWEVSQAFTASNTPPVAAFSPACTELGCSFSDQSTDGDGTITGWSWDFGDGNSSNSQNPSHSYADSGTYTVSLTVTDNDGSTDTTSQNITVNAAQNDADNDGVPDNQDNCIDVSNGPLTPGIDPREHATRY